MFVKSYKRRVKIVTPLADRGYFSRVDSSKRSAIASQPLKIKKDQQELVILDLISMYKHNCFRNIERKDEIIG